MERANVASLFLLLAIVNFSIARSEEGQVIHCDECLQAVHTTVLYQPQNETCNRQEDLRRCLLACSPTKKGNLGKLRSAIFISDIFRKFVEYDCPPLPGSACNGSMYMCTQDMMQYRVGEIDYETGQAYLACGQRNKEIKRCLAAHFNQESQLDCLNEYDGGKILHVIDRSGKYLCGRNRNTRCFVMGNLYEPIQGTECTQYTQHDVIGQRSYTRNAASGTQFNAKTCILDFPEQVTCTNP